ncbi:MAG: flippase-like domain-containing protein, partial [Elusimicrobia bacterium]|nr:flippase-like domain-containing protein [Elusimicrobiota bacterium]
VLVGLGLALAAGIVLVVTHRLRGVVHAVLAPSRDLLRTRRGAALFGLSILLWLAEGSVYAILGSVAGLHLSLADGFYVMALANLAAMIPAAPGYVGTYEFFGRQVLSVMGFPKGPSITLIVLMHFFQLLTLAVMAVPAIIVLARRRPPDEPEEQP